MVPLHVDRELFNECKKAPGPSAPHNMNDRSSSHTQSYTSPCGARLSIFVDKILSCLLCVDWLETIYLRGKWWMILITVFLLAPNRGGIQRWSRFPDKYPREICIPEKYKAAEGIQSVRGGIHSHYHHTLLLNTLWKFDKWNVYRVLCFSWRGT